MKEYVNLKTRTNRAGNTFTLICIEKKVLLHFLPLVLIDIDAFIHLNCSAYSAMKKFLPLLDICHI